MKLKPELRSLGIVGAALFTAWSMAGPSMGGMRSLEPPAEFRQLASYSGKKDPRIALGRYGMKTKHIKQLERAVGGVWCPGTRYGNAQFTTGFIAGDKGLLTTVAHAFVDEKGRLREPLSECTFMNLEKAQQTVRLNFDVSSFRFAPAGGDRVHVRLSSEIRGVQPLALDLSGDAVKVGDELVGISAAEEDYNPGQAIYRKFKVTQVSDDHVFFNSNAGVNDGGSGGPNLQIENDRLVVKGMFKSSFPVEWNGRPFNDNRNDLLEKQNYSSSIAIGSAAIDDIMALAGNNQIVTVGEQKQ